MATETAPLDTAVEIITPENIAFRYRVAGPFRRLPAYLIDLVIRVVLWGLGAILASLSFGAVGLPDVAVACMFVLGFFLQWFYGGLFEAFWNGQTPGKRLMKLRVLTVEGQPISGWQAMLRTILRAVDMLPVGYLVGLVTMAMNDRFQRLGDLAAGTMVVLEEPPWFQGVLQVQDPEIVRLAGEIPASFQASRTMARALATYVQRRPQFPWMRRLEIAQHLGEPLRQRFQLPPQTNLDLLLCALYYRTFITDRYDAQERALGSSPFATVAPLPAQVNPPTPEERGAEPTSVVEPASGVILSAAKDLAGAVPTVPKDRGGA